MGKLRVFWERKRKAVICGLVVCLGVVLAVSDQVWIWRVNPREDIVVATDKTMYGMGEQIIIGVTNNLNVIIVVGNVFLGIERLEGGEWVDLWLSSGLECSCDLLCYWGMVPDVDPGDNLTVVWEQKMWTYCHPSASESNLRNSTFVFALPGAYRVFAWIEIDPWRPPVRRPRSYVRVYSNEFEIRW